MAHELHLHLDVVVPDGTDVGALLERITGRQMPDVPGSWVAAATAGRCPGQNPDLDDPWQDVADAEADADAGLT